MRYDFTGKTVLVTGAGSGMGREAAVHAARHGAAALAVDSNRSALESLTNETGIPHLVADLLRDRLAVQDLRRHGRGA